MPLNDSRFTILPSPRPHPNYAAQKLDQLQADLVSTAKLLAAEEVGAAMAHQLNEPLTALLLYLNELTAQYSTGTQAVSNAMREMVRMALRETERVCDIMQRLGYSLQAPVDAEMVVDRDRQMNDPRAGVSGGSESPPLAPVQHYARHMLTPREREVLALVTGGASNKEGAHRLGISTRTFEVHRAHVMEKLGARNTADLVRKALNGFR